MSAQTGWVRSPEELDGAVALAERVFFGGKRGFAARYRAACAPANRDYQAVAVDGGAVVAAAFGHPATLVLDEHLSLTTLAVGGVCTDPAYRGRGLSSTLLAGLMARARDRGVDLLLISGEGPLYSRLGARKVGRLVEVKAPASALPGPPPAYRRHVRPTPEIVSWAAAAYRTTAPRFERTDAEFAELLTGHLSAFERETAALLVPREQPGYAVVRAAHEGSTKVGFLVEHAGDADLAWAMAMDDARDQGCDVVFTRLPSGLGPSWQPYATTIEITGTVVVLDPQRFLAAVARRADALGGPRLGFDLAGERVRLVADETVRVDLPVRDIAPYLWGTVEESDAAANWRLPSFRADALNFL